jgi:Uma2 family endonuclease
VEAGIWIADDSYYVADVVATCAPPAEDGIIKDPFLVVEVLSSSNDDAAFKRKMEAYIQLPSVQEIWLIDSRRRWVQPWRRAGEDRWVVTLPMTGAASFDSPSLGDSIALDRLYRNTGLD